MAEQNTKAPRTEKRAAATGAKKKAGVKKPAAKAAGKETAKQASPAKGKQGKKPVKESQGAAPKATTVKVNRKAASTGKPEAAAATKKGAGKQGAASGAAGAKQENPKRTQYYRHVRLERERPQLSRGGDGAGRGAAASRRRTFNTPEKDPNALLKVIPLGGLDAIGKNMTVFECGDDIVLDDAGCMFPDDNHPGIDLILPDYSYLLQNAERLRGIVITHGHEDHTGALPYLLKDLEQDVDIYGTKMTLGLIEGKFKEHRVKNARLKEIKPGDQVKLGCFTCDFFAVNHSIPGAVGVFFRSPAGNVMHTGDFKLDQTPIDGVCTDFGAIAEFGRIGVDLLMSDSTNANIPTFTPSEAEVGKVLRRIIGQATGRVIIASFASHIHRMQQICDAAIENGRKVVVTGRSMVQNTDIARRLGYLHISDEDLIDAYDLNGVPPEQIVVMCTGSQGEPLSALARIAGGSHKTISLDAGDTVIISATPVPGNEKAVTKVMNLLAKVGADVWDKRRDLVHVSGHGGAEELKIVLSIARPKAFLPVHGEAIHLRAHAKLGAATGVPPENIFILENGDTLELSAEGVRRGEQVQNGVVLVDGLSVGDTSQNVLDERSSLAAQGFATVAVAVDRMHRQIIGNVLVEMHGIANGDGSELVQEAQSRVRHALQDALDNEAGTKEIKKACRNALLKVLWENIKQRPMVIVNVLDV